MIKKFFYASTALLLSLLASPVLADNSVLTFGPGTSTTIQPGQTFSLTVSLNADIPFAGMDLSLLSSALNAFTVTGQTLSPFSPVTDPNGSFSSQLLPTSSPAGQANDYGYGTSNGQNVAAGNYPIETLTIASNNSLAPGNYTISSYNAGGHVTDIYNAGLTQFALPTASYSVIVAVPEPASIGMIVFGGAAMLMHRKPRCNQSSK